MPPHHPARDMWDTFHTTTPGVLLRTHTSPVRFTPCAAAPRTDPRHPARHVLPLEAITPRSEIMFHQVEGLVVGERSRWPTSRAPSPPWLIACSVRNVAFASGRVLPVTEPSD